MTCIRGGLGWVAQGLASSTGINVWKEREDEEKEKGTGERKRERECVTRETGPERWTTTGRYCGNKAPVHRVLFGFPSIHPPGEAVAEQTLEQTQPLHKTLNHIQPTCSLCIYGTNM